MKATNKKSIAELIAACIIENAVGIAAGSMSEYDLFDAVYGPLPVAVWRGEWCVTEPENFGTGVKIAEVSEDPSQSRCLTWRAH